MRRHLYDAAVAEPNVFIDTAAIFICKAFLTIEFLVLIYAVSTPPPPLPRIGCGIVRKVPYTVAQLALGRGGCASPGQCGLLN